MKGIDLRQVTVTIHRSHADDMRPVLQYESSALLGQRRESKGRKGEGGMGEVKAELSPGVEENQQLV